jgi:phosphate:Na+ symporter
MEFGFLDFLQLVGALGFFIYGMKIMSDGIQKVAGNKMREILSAMTSNRLKGVFTGFFVTSLIQSSSATTVMLVSFVNAGLLSLKEAIGVIMGANIGTTVTAWLIAIFGFKIKIGEMALPIIAFGLPMMFTNKDKLKSLGEVLVGFALLFMGLDALKESVPDLRSNSEMLEFLGNYAGNGILSVLLFVGVGTLITIVVQSSSAAMALTLTLLYKGVIPFEVAAAMVLGENIGTTITANLAAIIANVHAKRAARAHFIFNVFGVIWMILVFPYFLKLIDNIWEPFQEWMQTISPDIGKGKEEFQLSLFHTLFNLINTLILIWFVPVIAKIVTKMVKPKDEIDQEFHLEYIAGGVMSTPELSILEARKEISKFIDVVEKQIKLLPKLLITPDEKKLKKFYKKIAFYEEVTDRMEQEIADYLAKVAEGELSEQSSAKIRAMISIINDLEKIGDTCYQIAKIIERKQNHKLYFLPEQRENLNKFYDLLFEAFQSLKKSLNNNFENVNLEEAKKWEDKINAYRDKLRKDYLRKIEKGKYKLESGVIYADVFSNIEKIGDFIYNIEEAAAGKV